MARLLVNKVQKSIFIISLFFLSSCDDIHTKDEEYPVLHIYSWAEYIPPAVLEKFTKETGISITYDVFENNEALEAKLLIGGKDFDLVFPSASPFLARHIKANLYQKIDKKKLSNYKSLDKKILKIIAKSDPGNNFGIPYVWGTSGIGYNKKLVKTILGHAPPSSWDILFSPKYNNSLASCGIALIQAPFDVIAPILVYLGLNPNSSSKEDLKKAFLVLAKTRPTIQNFQAERSAEDLLSGNLCVAQVWSGNLLEIQQREKEFCRLKHPEKDCTESSIEYIVPLAGAEMWCDCMAIPINAEHPKNAHKFINFLLRPEIAASVTNHLLFANANKDSKPFIDPALLKNPILYPPAKVMKKLFIEKPQKASLERWRTKIFTRIKKKGGEHGQTKKTH